MKKVYICGDSFSSTDSKFAGLSWTEKLFLLLAEHGIQVVNLSRPCSSNFFIRLQVDHAIEHNADYVIFHGTSSLRDEIKFRKNITESSLFDRFVNLNDSSDDNFKKDLSCYSFLSIDHTTLFKSTQMNLLKDHFANFSDLALAIKKNQYIIESTLAALEKHKIPFIFDQGGFEHRSFENVTCRMYFKNYKKYFSKINLWDYEVTSKTSPCFHINDEKIHNMVATYYANEIRKQIK